MDRIGDKGVSTAAQANQTPGRPGYCSRTAADGSLSLSPWSTEVHARTLSRCDLAGFAIHCCF
jgi:hypothetical protein